MYQFIELKMFYKAYKVACLGVTNSDWFALGLTALDNLELSIAYHSFTQTKMLRYAAMVQEIEENFKSGEWKKEICQAMAAAMLGRFEEATKLFQKAGKKSPALYVYSDLRMFDVAQEFLDYKNELDCAVLMRKRAEWAKKMGELRAAAEMFFLAGDIQSTINLIFENNWIDMLIKVGRQLDKTELENLSAIAKKLKQVGANNEAAEIFSRLGGDSDIADILIAAQAWTEALEFIEKNPKLKSKICSSYAKWLYELGQYSEAQKGTCIHVSCHISY